MTGYGKNQQWVEIVKEVANKAIKQMREGKTSDEILQDIAKGMREANRTCSSAIKA